MMTLDIKLIDSWLEENRVQLNKEGVEVVIQRSDEGRPKTAVRLDFTRGLRIASIILWSNGDCEFDVLTEDGTDMISKYCVVETLVDFEAAIQRVMERM